MDEIKIDYLPYDRLAAFSQFDQAFLKESPALEPFIRHWASMDTLTHYADERIFPQERRRLLVEVLHRQYRDIPYGPDVKKNMERLGEEGTMTLTTAHQPVLLGGPLYIVYKIASTIHLSRRLNEVSEKCIVPVFVVGGEDHDREEMNHLYLFGQRLTWDTEQSGATGRFNNEGLAGVIDEVVSILGEGSNDLRTDLKNVFSSDKSYGSSYQKFIARLFDHYGLIVLNMDDPDLKRQFLPVIEREIMGMPSQSIIRATQEQLNVAGFSAQSYAREVNFFYLSHGARTLIQHDDKGYKIGEEVYSKEKMAARIKDEVENFSPNVIMRPLYQEYSLPNLAYIGGGGELAYWVERKSLFAYFDVPYPLLVRRNSVGISDSHITHRMQKIGFDVQDLTKDIHEVMRQIATQDSAFEQDFERLSSRVRSTFDELVDWSARIDPTVLRYAAGEATKLSKTMMNLEQKLVRSLKKGEEDTLRHLQKIYDHLFPENGLQERRHNFLPYYHRYGAEWLDFLIDQLDPLDRRFTLLIYPPQ